MTQRPLPPPTPGAFNDANNEFVLHSSSVLCHKRMSDKEMQFNRME